MLKASELAPPEISEFRVLRGGLIVAIGLVSAQITGYIRQATIGYLLGTGPRADALSVAMAPIELWWSVLALAVIYGFVPKLSLEAPGGPHAFRQVLKPVVRLAAGSSVCFFLFAPFFVRAFAPGLDAGTTELAADLLRVMAAAPAAVGASFVYSALLFSRRRFAVPSFQHAIVNSVTILGALALFDVWGAFGFAAGYSLGSWLQLWIAHVYASRVVSDFGGRDEPIGLVELLSGPGPILGQGLAMEMNTAVSRAFASTFGPGMTASFEYGAKLFRVPLALLVVPLAQSLLPEISARQSTAAQKRSALQAVVRAAGLITAAGAAVMLVMMTWREPLVSLLFERGVFGRESTEAVAVILFGYMPVIIGRGLCDFLSRMLFGMRRFAAPLAGAFVALVVNFAVCAALPSERPVLIGAGAVTGFFLGAAIIVVYVLRLRRYAR